MACRVMFSVKPDDAFVHDANAMDVRVSVTFPLVMSVNEGE